MDIAVKTHNRGALPADFFEEQQTEQTAGVTELTDPPEEEAAAEYPRYSHVRSPEIRRNGFVILMAISAVVGAAGGAVLAFSKNADFEALKAISGTLDGEFGRIFLQRALIGAAFLLAEYLLGFFALGDFLVWSAPMFYGMGLGLRLAASGKWILLPSAIISLAAAVFGAAVSASFSQTLFRLLRGGTVYLDSSPRKNLTLCFLGLLALVIASSIYEGIILNV